MDLRGPSGGSEDLFVMAFSLHVMDTHERWLIRLGVLFNAFIHRMSESEETWAPSPGM